MSAKKPAVGGEIDAYCTKCKMDLNHRIVAMVGEDVKRVECLTCHGGHNYRRPAAEREKEKVRKANAKAIHAPKEYSVGGPRPAARTEKSARVIWEKAITGQPPSGFRAYSTRTGFEPGDLIRHTKFGDGVVFKVLDAQKVEVIFEDGPKTMAQNL